MTTQTPDVVIDIYEKPNNDQESMPTALPSVLELYGISYGYDNLVPCGGDYLLTTINMVLERKRMSDLVSSFTRGGRKGKRRLDIQLQLCMDSYPNAKIVLLIEDWYQTELDFMSKCIWIPFKTERWEKKKEKKVAHYQKTLQESAESDVPDKIYDVDGTLIGDVSSEMLRRLKLTRQVRMNPKALIGKLDALQKKFGDRLEIVKTYNGEHASNWVVDQLAQVTKKRTSRVVPIRQKRPIESLEERIRFVIEGFPGLAGALGSRVIERYGTLEKAIGNVDNWVIDIKRLPKNVQDIAKQILTTTIEDARKQVEEHDTE